MHLLRRLIKYIRPYAGRLIAAGLMLAVAGGLLSVAIATFKPLVNEVLLVKATVEPSPSETTVGSGINILQSLRNWLPTGEAANWIRERPMVFVPLLIVVVSLLRAIFLYLGHYMTTKVGVSVIRDIRTELFASVVYQSISFFQTHTTGTLVSRTMADVQRLQRISTEVLADLIRVGAMVPFLIILIVLHDWRLSTLTVIALPLIVIPMAKLGKRLRSASRSSQENMAEASSFLTETVTGIRVVKSFVMEPTEIGRFEGALARMFRADLKAGRAAALSSPLMELAVAVTAAVIFVVAGLAIAAGRLDPGDFAVVIGGLGLLFASFRRLNRVNVEIQQALAAAERVFAILDTEPAVQELPGAAPLAGFDNSIHFEKVDFAYDGTRVLNDIDLRIAKGQTVALVGPSGSGKTTLASLLPRFFDPTAGRVALDGRDIREATLASLREQIGLVTQETHLFDDTVHYNIAHGNNDAKETDIERAAQIANAHEFIQQLPQGYDTRLGERGSRLSMGQRQRIAIARALFKDPPILILDEATSALDSESERLVQEALDTLLSGRTSIVIAHRLSTIQRADRILVLDDGRIVEDGTHDQLIGHRGLYARLHAMQFQYD